MSDSWAVTSGINKNKNTGATEWKQESKEPKPYIKVNAIGIGSILSCIVLGLVSLLVCRGYQYESQLWKAHRK